jgi:hypothetical protein
MTKRTLSSPDRIYLETIRDLFRRIGIEYGIITVNGSGNFVLRKRIGTETIEEAVQGVTRSLIGVNVVYYRTVFLQKGIESVDGHYYIEFNFILLKELHLTTLKKELKRERNKYLNNRK